MNHTIFKVYSDIYTVALLRDMRDYPAVAKPSVFARLKKAMRRV